MRGIKPGEKMPVRFQTNKTECSPLTDGNSLRPASEKWRCAPSTHIIVFRLSVNFFPKLKLGYVQNVGTNLKDPKLLFRT